eukprot:gene10491-10650_t
MTRLQALQQSQLTPQALQLSRHARRVYVGGLPPNITEVTLTHFFNQVMMAVGGCSTTGSPVIGCYMNPDKRFAFVEFRNVEEASNAMAFDGVQCQGEVLRIRRPHDYNPTAAKALGPAEPSPYINLALLSVVGGLVDDASAPRISVTGLPTSLDEEQVVIPRPNSAGSQHDPPGVGLVFLEYEDTKSAEKARLALNGRMFGDKPVVASIFDQHLQLLKTWTLDKYLKTKPPSSVVSLSAFSTCGQALRTLATHRISSAPVFDGSTYLGFIDVSDILRSLLGLVNVRELTEENRQYKLRAAGLQLEHQQLRGLNPAQDGALIFKADLHSTLHDVVLYGFLHPNAAGHLQVVHRVGVFDADESDTSDDDMEGQALGLKGISITHVISQSDVVQFLNKHIEELGSLADASLQQLGLASKAVVCVPGEMSTINAFASMVANRVSCVGVISHSHGGGLAASLSSSDLRGLLPEHFVALAAPVLHFLTAKASAGWAGQHQKPSSGAVQQQSPGHSPDQELQLEPLGEQSQQQMHSSAQGWGLKGAEGLKPLQLISCSPGSSLRQVLTLLATHSLHRLHVLDVRQRPVGIVTITDLLRVIVGGTELLEAVQPEVDMDEEVEQLQPSSDVPDCGMGLDQGQELIEPGQSHGLLPVHSSQQLLNVG